MNFCQDILNAKFRPPSLLCLRCYYFCHCCCHVVFVFYCYSSLSLSLGPGQCCCHTLLSSHAWLLSCVVSCCHTLFSCCHALFVVSAPDNPMTAEEAAQAIFPTLSRPLQKFLRVTRQQPRYSQDSVLEHLATCVSHDLSHKAFLSRYLSQVNSAF